MSDCLHCDIHEMLDVHLQNEQADLGEIAARVTEVLADLILMVPPADQAMLLAAVVSNLGGKPLTVSGIPGLYVDCSPRLPRAPRVPAGNHLAGN
jgi:hypothetical protein